MQDVSLPNVTIQQVMAFRTIYLLCDVSTRTGRLQATHFATVLSGGPSPQWGIFSARTGKLIQFAWSRAQVERRYPKKAWRKKQASWMLTSVAELMELEEREAALRKQLDAPAPQPGRPEGTVEAAAVA